MERTLKDLSGEEEQKDALFELTTRVYWSRGKGKGMEETVQMLFVPWRDGKYTLKPKTL